jgi:hypothetical protein
MLLLATLTLAHDLERLWQQAVEVSANHAYEYALA